MKKCDKIFTGLICLFFLGMSLLYVVLPRRDFSPSGFYDTQKMCKLFSDSY